jgi:16S rRNA (uracil1498-N3)-methyltransferase
MNPPHPRIRLFVDRPLSEGAAFALLGTDAHYLATVMRQKAGAEILVFNGRDGEWGASLQTVSRKAVAAVVGKRTRPQVSDPDLWLVFAPIKRTRIDFVSAKATELGVSRLLPVTTDRTVVTRVNASRLRANAKEAAEQCERLSVPEVEDLQPLKKLLARWPRERLLAFCDESREAPLLTEAALAHDRNPAQRPWAILIGPEGGFTGEEREFLRSLPFAVRAGLGPRLLRADSAAFAAISLWQAAIGDWA